jgi:ornithine carbamoyltransferase
MTSTVPHRHLWSPERLSSADLHTLLDTAAALKRAKQSGHGWGPLRGRHLALLSSDSDGAVQAFRHAVQGLGGTVAHLDAHEWQSSAGERVPDAARMLGRLYDAIDCCDLPGPVLEQIDRHSGVPVFNGLACASHPLSAVGALLTMREAGAKPLHRLHVQFTGDADAARRQAAAVLARLAGIDVRTHDGADRELDFIFDPQAVSSDRACLTLPGGTSDDQARLAALLAGNRECTLQALMVCSLH